MTPEQFAKRMQAIHERNGKDREAAHEEADELMAETLRSLGYGAGVAIFEKLEKWYA